MIYHVPKENSSPISQQFTSTEFVGTLLSLNSPFGLSSFFFFFSSSSSPRLALFLLFAMITNSKFREIIRFMGWPRLGTPCPTIRTCKTRRTWDYRSRNWRCRFHRGTRVIGSTKARRWRFGS